MPFELDGELILQLLGYVALFAIGWERLNNARVEIEELKEGFENYKVDQTIAIEARKESLQEYKNETQQKLQDFKDTVAKENATKEELKVVDKSRRTLWKKFDRFRHVLDMRHTKQLVLDAMFAKTVD